MRTVSEETAGASALDSLAQRIAAQDQAFSGTLGVFARDLRTGLTLRHRADETFPTASTIKLPILLELARQVHAGRLAWSRPLTLDPANRVEGSGVARDLDERLTVSLHDWATLMMVLSDNTAANQLLDVVGVDQVNASLRRWGAQRTTLHRKVTFAPNPPTPYFGTGTPADFGHLLVSLARGELLPPDATHTCLEVLRRQQATYLGRLLPYDAFMARQRPGRALTLYAKHGLVEGVRNEVGIVRAEGVQYVVAVFTRDAASPPTDPVDLQDEGVLVVARASRAVWDVFGAG